MKNIRIRDKQNKIISDLNHYENENDFLDLIISTNYFGKSERWVLQNSEPYETSDILETEERKKSYTVSEINELGHTVEVIKEEIEVWVKLKADYSIEIIDLSQDYNWLLEQCHAQRRAAYPPLADFADALYWKEQGDSSKLESYLKACEEVKKRFPLPKEIN